MISLQVLMVLMLYSSKELGLSLSMMFMGQLWISLLLLG